mgnify:CR=1 FL=1
MSSVSRRSALRTDVSPLSELYLYAGVACECAAKSKKNHKKAEMILKDGLMHSSLSLA